ncbi:archaetidylserine decarboxylase, partial [Roseateles sp. GG27B]
MSDRLAVLPQYLMPKQAMTRFGGLVAGSRMGWLTTTIIRRFVKRYNVNMAEAVNPDISSYTSFND